MSNLQVMASYLGKVAALCTGDGITVNVKILDGKQAYGNVRFVIEPIAGKGTATVDSSRLAREDGGMFYTGESYVPNKSKGAK